MSSRAFLVFAARRRRRARRLRQEAGAPGRRPRRPTSSPSRRPSSRSPRPIRFPRASSTLQLVESRARSRIRSSSMRIDSGKTMADFQTMMTNPNAPDSRMDRVSDRRQRHRAGRLRQRDRDARPRPLRDGVLRVGPRRHPASRQGDGAAVRGRRLGRRASAPSRSPTSAITRRTTPSTSPAPLTAGTHTIRVENAGPQVHEVPDEPAGPRARPWPTSQAWVQGGMKGAAAGQAGGRGHRARRRRSPVLHRHTRCRQVRAHLLRPGQERRQAARDARDDEGDHGQPERA